MSVEKQTLLEARQRADTGSSAGAGGPAPGATAETVGLWGTLSKFLFSPGSREAAPATSAAGGAPSTKVNLPKNLSHVSFTSECFSDGNYFDVGDSGSDADPASPRTPPPPSMRRNGASFGSFNSVQL